jgi:phage-related tail protein
MSTVKAAVLADVQARLQKELTAIHAELNNSRYQMNNRRGKIVRRYR